MDQVWAQFEGEEVAATKTLAHASDSDVEAGRSTCWERAANGHADRLAKLGAAAHELAQESVDNFLGLAQLVKEAAQWAGEHESWMRVAGLSDCDSIVDPPLGATVGPANHGQERRPSMDEPVARNGHSLRAADMLTGPHGSAIFCTRCGALAVQRRGLLKRRCRGLRVGSQGDWQSRELLGSSVCRGS